MAQRDRSAARRSVFLDRFEEARKVENAYTEAALSRHKRQGLELAIKARWIAMGLIAALLPFLTPWPEVLFYHAILGLLCLNGWVMRRAGKVGQSRKELGLIFLDLLIMTLGMVLPNPLSQDPVPLAMQYRFEFFQYFFVILAAGTLAYSWRTVIAIGTWTAAMWLTAMAVVYWVSTPFPGLSEASAAALAEYPRIARLMDPNSINVQLRVQEVVVFVIVAVTLAFSARRFNTLLMNNAGLARERANLSRYFSPNVVEELSQKDEPLKAIRSHDIAVLFVDIVGFTRFAADRDAREVIEVLRAFHARMEAEVFRHGGTLDKYLGDGLMATFGTPEPGARDAGDALDCARAMIGALDGWNRDRVACGEPEIRAGIGIHHGPAVLGDIGSAQLEFAVVGNTVNLASRLEALTREVDARLVISDALHRRVVAEAGPEAPSLAGLTRREGQCLRGSAEPMTVWMLQ